jgi:hypothetical protein
MGYTAASKHHDIIIDDPALTEHGFTKFSLPLNGGNATAAVMVVHNTDKSKMMYPNFYKSDLDKTVQSLKDKIESDGILIDNDTADALARYLRNKCAELEEDPDNEFFKNGNGNGKTSKSKPKSGHSNGNGKGGSKRNEPEEIISKSQIYKLGDHFLAEAVLIGEHNQPYWITSESLIGQISTQRFIDITDDIDGKRKKHLYAPRRSLYLNEPYTFDSVEQINQLIEDVKANETPDTLFSKIKAQWKKYVSESDSHINLCAADCVFTFFQDRLGTTHYLFFVADTEAGKSSNLFMFKYLAYRAFLAIDISIANIYRFYGNEFEGIGTLLEDEIDDLDQQPEKLRSIKVVIQKASKYQKAKRQVSHKVMNKKATTCLGLRHLLLRRCLLHTRPKVSEKELLKCHVVLAFQTTIFRK